MNTNTTANKNAGQDPSELMAENTITANPAAGPLTPRDEPLAIPTTIPPMIPDMMPENKGAPDARAIPRHKGMATKNTTILAGISLFSSRYILNIIHSFWFYLTQLIPRHRLRHEWVITLIFFVLLLLFVP